MFIQLLKAVVGFVIGGIIGGILGVVGLGIFLFVIYPMILERGYHEHVSYDQPGLAMVPLLGAPVGAIIGAALGTFLALRVRTKS